MSLNIGELVGYLRIDETAWVKGLVKAQAKMEAVGKSDAFKKLDSAVNKSASGFVKLATKVAQVGGGVTGIQQVAAAVVSLSGAAGLLPAAAGAGAVAMVALKVGTSGFGQSLKDLGDPKKFAADLATLAPAARADAKEIAALRPQWDRLRKSVQQTLFADTAGQIRQLASEYLPVLRAQLGGVAGGFNIAAVSTGNWLKQGSQVRTVNTTMTFLGNAVNSVTLALQPAVQIMLALVSAGSSRLPALASGFAAAAGRAAAFVQNAKDTGQLGQWIDAGLHALGQLRTILGNLIGIVAQVFGAFDDSGASALDTLVRLTGTLRTFLASAQGQQALHSLAAVLGTVSQVVSGVLLVALHQAAPVVVALEPAFAGLALQVGGVLVQALTTAGPLLLSLAGWLSQNIGWLGPLAIGLFGAVKAFQAVTAAMKVLKLVTSTNPWVLLITVTVALVTLIVTHWHQIVNAVSTAISTVVDFVKSHWQLLISIILGPLGVIIALVVSHFTQIKNFISSVLSTVVGFVKARINDVINFFGFLASLPGRVAAWFGRIKDGAVARLVAMINWVRGLPGRILGALGNLGGLLVNAGKNIVQGLWHGITSLAGWLKDKVLGWVTSVIPGPIARALGIASPSKVAAKLARWWPEGMAVGLDAGSAVVVRSAQRLAGSVTAALTPAAAGIPTVQLAVNPSAPAAGTPGGSDRALVSIGHYHPPADASAHDVAMDLDWFSRAGG